MMSVFMLSVFMLSAFILNVTVDCCGADQKRGHHNTHRCDIQDNDTQHNNKNDQSYAECRNSSIKLNVVEPNEPLTKHHVGQMSFGKMPFGKMLFNQKTLNQK
jgi:hypothetical protein